MVVTSRNDLLMCLTFPSSLEGVVLDWFYFLPPHSFCNFKVSGAFLTQYVSRWEAKRNNHHLFTVKIRQGDSLESHVGAKVPNWSDDVSALTFISGCKCLTPCTNIS